MGSIEGFAATMRQRPRHTIVGIAAFATVLLFVLHNPQSTGLKLASSSSSRQPTPPTSQQPPVSATKPGEKLYGAEYPGHSYPADINRVTNDTLGFSKIFVVGLPERSDKRDAIVLTSALTGFHVDFVDGVRGESIHDKAVPFGADRKALWENNLGSWRGHMNAIRRIVEEGLDSALIMEDDMDWDVRLQSQLEQVATGTRTLLHSRSSSPHSPYGDEWDILWMGHCGEIFPEILPENDAKPPEHPGLQFMKKKFTIENDVTVPPPDKVTGLVDFKSHPYTRWVHIGAAPICTFAYALSQKGAQKVLYDISVDHLLGAFDNALAGLCRRSIAAVGETEVQGDRGMDTKCISVNPPIFFHHKAKGLVNGDSDIQNVGGVDMREKGTSENIVWSARNNIRNMIMGTKMESQF